MRLIICALLILPNYWAVITWFPDWDPVPQVFTAFVLAVLEMVLILIPIATKAGWTNDGAADAGGGWNSGSSSWGDSSGSND